MKHRVELLNELLENDELLSDLAAGIGEIALKLEEQGNDTVTWFDVGQGVVADLLAAPAGRHS